MEPNRPLDMPEETKGTYTPGQQAVLKLVQWGAGTVAFVAMLDVIHS